MNQKNSPTSVVGQYLASPGRAWFDRSFPHLASYPIGKEVPDACIPLTGNTTVKLDIISMLQTNPTPTPVFDSARCNVRVFFVPQRLYVRGLQNDNYMETDDIETKELPTVAPLPYTSDASHSTTQAIIPYGSLLNRLGLPASLIGPDSLLPLNPNLYFDEDTIKPIGTMAVQDGTQIFNMSSVIAYFDVCTYFLANPYDKDIPFDVYTRYLNTDNATGDFVLFNNDDFDEVKYINLKDLQATIQGIKGIVDSRNGFNIPAQSSYLSNTSVATGVSPFRFGNGGYSSVSLCETILTTAYPNGTDVSPVVWVNTPAYELAKVLGRSSSTLGLFPATYMEDYQSTWFDIDDINSLNAVKLAFTDGGTNLDEVRIKQSIWNRMLRTILRGKRISDWMDVQFGRKLSLSNHPIMVGADSFDITWDDVLAHNANNGVDGDGYVPLGAAAGRGNGGSDTRRRGKRDRTITFTTQEPGYLLIIRDIVPYVSYPDARARHWDYTVMADFPLPMYSGKTFQDLAVSDILVTSNDALNNTVVGKQPLYYDHMTSSYTLGGLMQTSLYDSYTFKRVPNLNDMSVDNSETNVRSLRSTYVLRSMYDFQFTDWSQNNGENIFIKSFYNLRCFQPLDKQVIKTRL